jgi:hypothetical protein
MYYKFLIKQRNYKIIRHIPRDKNFDGESSNRNFYQSFQQ